MISGRGNPHAALRPPLLTRGALAGEGYLEGLSLALRATFRESTLIRLAFGQPPSPFKGEGFRAAARAAPTTKPDREHWFGKVRRSRGTAPATIFAYPGPSGPAGI